MHTLFLSGLLLFSASIAAQGGDGTKDLYYENYQSARQHFAETLKQEPANAGAWLGMTTATLMSGDITTAHAALLDAPADTKSDPYFDIAYGEVLLAENKKDSAKQFFEHAIDATRGKNSDVLASIASAEILLKNGDAKYALELLEKARKRDKNNARLLVLTGDAYLKLADGTHAYEAYNEAVSKDDKLAQAYHRIGEIFLSQKNPELYLQYFNKAIAADPQYGPSLYRLYAYEFFHDPAKALDYYNRYLAVTDPNPAQAYELADLFYLNHQYDQAITKAKSILDSAHQPEARLYKMLAYSYAGKQDTAAAADFMNNYFAKEADSNIIAKDFTSMGDFLLAVDKDSLARTYYAQATSIEKDSTALAAQYGKLASLAASAKDFDDQANWLGKYYQTKDNATNLDLFNWGLAGFRAGNYPLADSVFGMYVEKYPEQSFGYYWQARSNAAQDTDDSTGHAITYYTKLVDVLGKDTANANYKKWMVEAYAYLAAYEANTEKDYDDAIVYFQKILEVDPDNEAAKKYITLLDDK